MASLGQLSLADSRILVYAETNNPIIEPLGGIVSMDQVMRRFPDTVYHTGRDTRLYKYLLAMCGESGAGLLKKQAIVARLKNESALLIFKDLDTLYSHTFRFNRIKSELYDFDAIDRAFLATTYNPEQMALEKQVWDKIQAADQSYHRRVMEFFHATRLGNSPEGMRLAAQSGSGEDIEIIENYKYVFDTLTDDPLGLMQFGATTSISEFILRPGGLANPNTAVLITTVQINGAPTGGTFKLSYDNAQTAAITWTVATDLSVPIAQALVGTTLINPLDITVVPTVPGVFTSYDIQFSNNDLSTYLLAPVLPNSLTGGTHPSVTMSYTLNDSYYMSQVTDPPFLETATIRMEPSLQHNMVNIVDRLRPVGTLMTVDPTTSTNILVPAQTVFASSENLNVVRFVVGAPSVDWPALDPTQGFFIEGASVESESTNFPYAGRAFPVLFQTVDDTHAYSDSALADPSYDTSSFYTQVGARSQYDLYKSEHDGAFQKIMTLLYPFLTSVQERDRFPAELAVASQNTPLVFIGQTKNA